MLFKQTPPFIIGLTGGIGAGKSTVAHAFAKLGASIIDTDDIAHQLTQAHGQAIPCIEKQFGSDFIKSDGALDRGKMRELIFQDTQAKQKLEAILHPMIHERVMQEIEQVKTAYALLVVPLLFETNRYQTIMQRALVIDCEEAIQIQRSMARSQLCENEVKAIMAQQMSREHRLAQADDIIINNGNLEKLYQNVLSLHQQYLTLKTHSQKQ